MRPRELARRARPTGPACSGRGRRGRSPAPRPAPGAVPPAAALVCGVTGRWWKANAQVGDAGRSRAGGWRPRPRCPSAARRCRSGRAGRPGSGRSFETRSSTRGAARRVAQSPVHAERLGQRLESGAQGVEVGLARDRVEHDAHEEAAGLPVVELGASRMLRPPSNRKRATPATMPGTSAQERRSTIWRVMAGKPRANSGRDLARAEASVLARGRHVLACAAHAAASHARSIARSTAGPGGAGPASVRHGRSGSPRWSRTARAPGKFWSAV